MNVWPLRKLSVWALLYGSPLATYAHGPSLPATLWQLTGWLLVATLSTALALLGIKFCLWLRANNNRSNY